MSAVVITVALAGLLVTGIAAAENAPSRSEYVEQLEAICKPRALATEKATKGVRSDIQAERLGVAAGKFSTASRIFAATIKAISPIARPSADRPRLAQWFVDLGQEEAYLKEIASQLGASHAIKAQRLTARFIHSGNQANNVVLAFGFNYCSFKFSRFG